MSTEIIHKKEIKSFVRREGRITAAQKEALLNLASMYMLPIDQGLFNFQKIFNRDAEVILEIGFGMGQSLVEMAALNPDADFIGIEVYRAGIGSCLNAIHQQQLKNVRLIEGDAVEVLQQCFPDKSLDRIQIYFPDPWPKKRHHKRRLIQPEFLQLIKKKLKQKGVLHLATDWENYAEQMLEVLSADDDFVNFSQTNTFIERPDFRPLTKFEKRGEKLGHGVWDLMFKLTKRGRVNVGNIDRLDVISGYQ